MLEHGGKLRAAARQYNIPVDDWLDLSAAINPSPYPVGNIPATIWQRLPEDDDELEYIAAQYYGTDTLLPIAGSQAAIQALPALIGSTLRVGILHPTYNEHPHAWKKSGCDIFFLHPEHIDKKIDQLDVLLVVNPNNPTGHVFSAEKLLLWHKILREKNGWLVVDEAFIDADPQHSVASRAHQHGLIVLRSLGKFFGLAGARVGFVFAEKNLLAALHETLGPWTISRPSRLAAIRALQDTQWQRAQCAALSDRSTRLAQLLTQHHLTPTGGCALFQWICTPHAQPIHQHLAQQGILTRVYDTPSSIRFGLPDKEAEWQRLGTALQLVSL
ncbi:MAG TPA: threonine-phosphate decarboxylase CobD [Pseudomonadales bacterium]|nr:threonine-phosphate decarboxylase CobD [Pseudomonadales bacterium]